MDRCQQNHQEQRNCGFHHKCERKVIPPSSTAEISEKVVHPVRIVIRINESHVLEICPRWDRKQIRCLDNEQCRNSHDHPTLNFDYGLTSTIAGTKDFEYPECHED